MATLLVLILAVSINIDVPSIVPIIIILPSGYLLLRRSGPAWLGSPPPQQQLHQPRVAAVPRQLLRGPHPGPDRPSLHQDREALCRGANQGYQSVDMRKHLYD